MNAQNTHMAVKTPLAVIVATIGTWAMAVAANLWTLNKTAGDNTSVLQIPILTPQNSQDRAGGLLQSVDIYYVNATANLDAMSAKVYKAYLPAQGVAQSVVELPSTSTFTLTQAQHKVTITITTPVYVAEDEDVYVELTIDAAATSVVKLQGAVSNYTLRV